MSRPKFTAGYKSVFLLVDELLELMQKRGATRTDLARRLGVHRSTVARWFDSERLTVFNAAMIADALGGKLEIRVKAEGEITEQRVDGGA